MKKILTIFLLGFGAAGGLFASLNYHFILTDKKLVVERKSELTFEDTFVDTRDWGIGDYLKHPRIASVLATRGIRSAFGGADGAAEDAVKKTRKALDQGLEKVQEQLRK